MIRMLVGTALSGRMYGICIAQQNWTLDGVHFLGGRSFAVCKNVFFLNRSPLLLSRLQMSFHRRVNNVEHTKSECCRSKFFNCKPSLQNKCEGCQRIFHALSKNSKYIFRVQKTWTIYKDCLSSQKRTTRNRTGEQHIVLTCFVEPGMPGMICQTSDLAMLSEAATLAASNMGTSTLVLQDRDLISAIIYEAERGYGDAQGRTMRFSIFLYSRLLPLCSPLSHKSSEANALLEEVKNYNRVSTSDRLELLNKVSLLMGYGGVNALIVHERALRESVRDLQGIACGERGPGCSSLFSSSLIHPGNEVTQEISLPDESDILLACQKFPSITLGNSLLVDLYSPSVEDTGRNTEDSTQAVVDHILENHNMAETRRTARDEPDHKGSCFELDAELQLHTLQLDKQYLHVPSEDGAQGTARDEPNEDASCFEKGAEQKACALQLNKHHLSINDKLETSKNAVLQQGSILANNKVVQRKLPGISKETVTPINCFLDTPIGTAQCVRASHRRRLDENGFHTIRKLLHHFPRTYVSPQDAEGQVEEGQYLNFFGRILSSRGRRAGLGLGVLEVIVSCQTHGGNKYCSGSGHHEQEMTSKRTVYLHLKKFFRGVRFTNLWVLNKIQSKYHEGDLVSVSGKVKALEADNHFEIREYNLEVLEEQVDLTSLDLHGNRRPYPIYPSKGSLDTKFIEDCIKRVLQTLPMEMDPIPNNICEKFNLMGLREAYFGIHCPKEIKEAECARRRFVFDEFFYLQLGLLFQRYQVEDMYIKACGLAQNSTGLEVGSLGTDKWSYLTLKVMEALPYSLTSGQLKAASEIIWDLRRPVPMSRLLQGDVGCGKTVVALLAALEVIHSGYQAAFMVPTELLAVQHYEFIVSILERMNENDRPSVALLTGSTPLKQARNIRNGLETGEIALVVGTHSLISERVNFAALCFAVIDEQHRFGVAQRGRFNSKVCTSIGSTETSTINLQDGHLVANKTYFVPHILVMSATPIPRTLALAFHGDLSFSQINDLPPGRVPVKTFAFHGNSAGLKQAYQMVQRDLDSGGRVFFVYPAIEESEILPQLHAAAAELETISNQFKTYKCGLLHGRMKITEKEEAMQRFKAGETKIMLSTQVIEVGIDIPEASMIVIMNAERFGMAQLHQLRGRVGRGTRESTCILLSSSLSALHRLKLLEQSTDGFYLAEADLQMRGPGDMLGSQQSGYLPEFSVARLEMDGDILEQAHIAAMDILQNHRCLDGLSKLKSELSIRHPPCSLGA